MRKELTYCDRCDFDMTSRPGGRDVYPGWYRDPIDQRSRFARTRADLCWSCCGEWDRRYAALAQAHGKPGYPLPSNELIRLTRSFLGDQDFSGYEEDV